MFLVEREFSISYAHRLLHHDGKCRFLHGHNGKILITLAFEKVDSNTRMAIDFEDIDAKIGMWLDENMDHATLLNVDDPLYNVLFANKHNIYAMAGDPSAENIAQHIYEICKRKQLPILKVKFWETDKCSASYCEGK